MLVYRSSSGIVLVAVFVCCYVQETCGSGTFYWKFRNKIERERYERLKKEAAEAWLLTDPIIDFSLQVPDLYMQQPLDHFDPTVKGSYKQRYWVNTRYWTKPKSGPVFLYIGGEGALNQYVVQGGQYIKWAKEHGALLVAAEHRFYGASINVDGLKLEQLQYLSSQHALADLAAFHSFISDRYNLTTENKWICFGGSYPGALSAWFRIKYPHLVIGAVSSSAPVHAQVNFEGFNDVVTGALTDPIVNGSTKCHNMVKEAFDTVDHKIASGNYKDLEADFGTCEPLDSMKDVSQFVTYLADIFMSTVQYNEEIVGHNVSNICNTMCSSGASGYVNLQNLVKKTLGSMGEKCVESSWTKVIARLQNTKLISKTGVGYRQWIYQTCTQFGYYQTCDANTTCIFSKYMTLNPYLEICKIVFNMDTDLLYSQVKFTNSYYGSNQPKGTKIVFVNGSVDPWHALGILKNQSRTELAIFIKGTAHCADMLSDRPTDPPQLTQARQAIGKVIAGWLAQ